MATYVKVVNPSILKTSKKEKWGGGLSDLLKIFWDNKGKEPVGGQVAAENGVSTPLGK